MTSFYIALIFWYVASFQEVFYSSYTLDHFIYVCGCGMQICMCVFVCVCVRAHACVCVCAHACV